MVVVNDIRLALCRGWRIYSAQDTTEQRISRLHCIPRYMCFDRAIIANFPFFNLVEIKKKKDKYKIASYTLSKVFYTVYITRYTYLNTSIKN